MVPNGTIFIKTFLINTKFRYQILKLWCPNGFRKELGTKPKTFSVGWKETTPPRKTDCIVPLKPVVCEAICNVSCDIKHSNMAQQSTDAMPTAVALSPESSGTDKPLQSPLSSPNNGSAAGVSSEKNSAWSSSFTTPEDEAVVKVWVRISEDAVICSDQ